MHSATNASASAALVTSDHAPSSAHDRLTRILLAAALVLAFLSFAGSLNYEFVYDDGLQIQKNPVIRQWSDAPSYVVHNVWYPVVPDSAGIYYRPGFIFWLLLNYKMGGLNPYFWHLSTVLMHGLAVWLVFLVAGKLLRDRLGAAIAALIFAVHPAHIESVAWVSGVTDPLLAAFLLPSLYQFIRWRESGAKRHLMLSLLFYAGATSIKETAVVLPMFTAAYDIIYAPALRPWMQRMKQAFLALLPFVAVTLGYLVLRHHVLLNFLASRPPKPLLSTLLTMPWLLVLYARHLVWPYDLLIFYDVTQVQSGADPRLWGGVLGCLLMLAGIYWLGKKWREPAAWYGGAIFVLGLSPALYGIRYLDPGELIHDRYLYLPIMGFALLVAVLFQRWLAAHADRPRASMAKYATLGALIAVLSVSTAVQEIDWASNLLLFYRAYRKTPSNLLARNGLASALADRKETGQAFVLYKETLAMDPDFWRTNMNFGIFLLNIGHYEEALKPLTHAKELGNGHGNYDFFIGLAKLRMGKAEEAEPYLRNAVQMSPQRGEVHRILAEVLYAQGRRPEAIAEMEQATRLTPSSAYAAELNQMREGAALTGPESR